MTRREFIGGAAALAAVPAFAQKTEDIRANLSLANLKGFLMAPWAGDFDETNFLQVNFADIDQIAAAL